MTRVAPARRVWGEVEGAALVRSETVGDGGSGVIDYRLSAGKNRSRPRGLVVRAGQNQLAAGREGDRDSVPMWGSEPGQNPFPVFRLGDHAARASPAFFIRNGQIEP